MSFMMDFETNTGDIEETRVWGWACISIDSPDDSYIYGNDITSWFKFMENLSYAKETVYFHNAKFDCDFIINFVLGKGWEYKAKMGECKRKCFTALIGGNGAFYQMRLYFAKNRYVTIIDSLKILPFKVKVISKAFGLEETKLRIDYKRIREEGYELTPKDIEYMKNDVTIVGKALGVLFSQGLTKMTQAANAMYDYKNTIGNYWKYYFPEIPNEDSFIRKSYRGGFTFLNPRFKGKEVGKGIVFDINSLYPYVMRYELLPYGQPVYYEGQYQKSETYPLYVQHFSCMFDLKPGHIPTLQIKHSLRFVGNEYLTTSKGERVELYLTNVDLELFLEHYDIADEIWIDGYKLKGTRGMFIEYIDKWMAVKIQATKDKNLGLRSLSKLMLNALYGRFGLNPITINKVCSLGDDGQTVYTNVRDKDRKPVYIPVATFVTAYARKKTITSAQAVYDRFIYADTDSLHLIGEDMPEGLEIDPVKLGAWKHESSFIRGRYLRQKCYIELEPRRYQDTIASEEEKLHSVSIKKGYRPSKGRYHPVETKVTVAGLPEECHKKVTWDNFRIKAKYHGKLIPKRIKGGTVLVETDFTIAE